MNLYDDLENLLKETFVDKRIDAAEKATLFDSFLPLTPEQRAYVRNRAFDLVKAYSREQGGEPPFKWLEHVIKSLDNTLPVPTSARAYFSPGTECREAILGMIKSCISELKVCVFTISDNLIRDELLLAHKRGVRVQVISDNDKTADLGNDVIFLERSGLPVRIDKTRHHMHHKFVIADRKQLATGSYNWTRSAGDFNHENLLIIDDKLMLAAYEKEFDKLWLEFS